MAIATRNGVYPEDSTIEGGRLSIGGCDAVELAREFGTPAYVVAEKDLRARAHEFLAAHPGPGEILFATKAFPCTAVLRVFADEGLSVDVASGGELHLALKAGFSPERIYLHGNAKSNAELQAAVDAGVGHIVMDGSDPERLEELVPGRQRVLIRVIPGVHADTHEAILTGHDESKFGYGPARAQALAEASYQHLDVVGLHMHIGSQLFDLGPFRPAIAALAEVGDFETYNLGGGMGAAYTSDERAPGVAEWVGGVARIAHDLLGRDKRLLFEPGRALVANAGVTLYRVEDVKRIPRSQYRGMNIVAIDGGMSDNLRPMLYGAVYDAEIADRIGGGGDPFMVVGKHCESGDVITRGVRLDPHPGDVIVTPATGAYGYALSNNYNGVPRPPVIFCADGDARVVVRRETLEELGGRDV